jgi:cytochrome c biogenesis protein
LTNQTKKRTILEQKESNSLSKTVWSTFSSLRLTIFLLILLAATSVLGTIILQNGTPQQYLAEYGPKLVRILGFFGLLDMYHSWWFLAILVLLVLNLVFCSLKRLPTAWRQVFHPRIDLTATSIHAQPFTKTFQVSKKKQKFEEELERGVDRVFGRSARIETPERLLLYFEKGKYGRLGVYVVHLSIIVIIVGGMIGSVFGFSGILKIAEGETVETILLRKDGRFVHYPLGYQVRCDDFDITYYDTPGPEKFVSEYTSSLTILENGQEVRREKVRVNHPLTHGGLKFYQSSYGKEAEVGLRINKRGEDTPYEVHVREGERESVPGSDLVFQFLQYFPEVHQVGEGIQLALFPGNKPPRRIWLFKEVPDFDEKRGGEFVFALNSILIRDFTVLQVGKDPGVWVVWIGCGLLILGLIMAFFIPHRRLWVHISREHEKPGKVLLGGTTNRNSVGFEREFAGIIRRLEQIGLRAV